MARMTSSAAFLPVYALDLVRRRGIPLLCVYTAGMLAHTLLMRGLVAFTDVNTTLALAGLGLTLLITLVTYIVMFQLLRPGLPMIDAELGSEVVRRNKRSGFAERERRVVDGVALAIFPFLLFYGAWGLIEEQFDVYTISLFNSGGLEAFAAPTELTWFGLPLVVALAAWVLRRVCGHFYESNRNPALGVLTALFEGVWMFLVLFSIGAFLSLSQEWMSNRVVWVGVETGVTDLLDGLGNLVNIPELSAGVAAALAATWSSVKEGFFAPMLWLTITAVVYRAQVDDHDAIFDERRGGGQFGAAINRAAKLGRVFGKFASSDFRDRISPCLNAVRFVLGAGPVFYLSFCLYFVLLDVLFSQLGRGALVLLGPGTFQGELWPWLQPVDFAVDALHMIFRLCLLAAAFEIALRRAEDTSRGRRVWLVARHSSPVDHR